VITISGGASPDSWRTGATPYRLWRAERWTDIRWNTMARDALVDLDLTTPEITIDERTDIGMY
jgi:hypothetical protein